jgi:hypothetical protein
MEFGDAEPLTPMFEVLKGLFDSKLLDLNELPWYAGGGPGGGESLPGRGWAGSVGFSH